MAVRHKYLLFDADGTLYDFNADESLALKETWEVLGIPQNESTLSAYHRRNSEAWAQFERGEITIETLQLQRFELFLKNVNLQIDPAVANRTLIEHLSQHGELFQGALEVLTELKRRNYEISLCTNGIHEVQVRRLRLPETVAIYRNVFTPYTTGSQKPHKEFFDYVCHENGITDRSEAIVIGDSLSSDIQGGINAGIETVWYNPGKKSSGSLKPTYVITDLKQLLDIFPPRE
jgi:YjjG family noncanonical pyrimidine nucleotidase